MTPAALTAPTDTAVVETIGLTQALELVDARGGDKALAREVISSGGIAGTTSRAFGKSTVYTIPAGGFQTWLDANCPEAE
jgi:hypothetical protein